MDPIPEGHILSRWLVDETTDRRGFFLVLDSNGHIEDIHPSFAFWLGKSRSAILGASLSEIIPSEHREAISKAIRSSSPQEFSRFLAVTDDPLSRELTFAPLFDQEGSLVHWVGYLKFPSDALSRPTLSGRNRTKEIGKTIHEPITLDKLTHVLGKSEAISNLLDLTARVASLSTPVLITGESGTGKELIARAIHDTGSGIGRPFVRVGCMLLPRDSTDTSSLEEKRETDFRTVARWNRLFRQAEGGSIFLDEVGELGEADQLTVLRAIERMVSEEKLVRYATALNVRVIASSSGDLSGQTAEGSFRRDLFNSMSGSALSLPPLRARPEDILPVAGFFLDKHAPGNVTGFSSSALEAIGNYPWPGNLKEMETTLRQAAAVAEGPLVDSEDLPARIARYTQDLSARLADLVELPASLSDTVAGLERQVIQRALIQCNGNRSQTAKTLRMNRTTLVKKIQRLGLTNFP